MKSYAGIGSRDINIEEEKLIKNISFILSKRDFICYSGNASGSDIAFQEGSNGKCIIFLPWERFNIENFDYRKENSCLNYFIVGNNPDGYESINKYHPNPLALSYGAKKLMNRNYFQVMGYSDYPKINFIICCANEDNNGNIIGGTGQACRIAKDLNIEVINIRSKNWKINLLKIIKNK